VRETFIAYFREMVNLISVLLRDIMVLMVDADSGTLINSDYKEKLMELAALTKIDTMFFLIRKMEFLLRDIQRNLNARVLILEFINSYAPGTDIPRLRRGQGRAPTGGAAMTRSSCQDREPPRPAPLPHREEDIARRLRHHPVDHRRGLGRVINTSAGASAAPRACPASRGPAQGRRPTSGASRRSEERRAHECQNRIREREIR
jgi:hypothetical protein